MGRQTLATEVGALASAILEINVAINATIDVVNEEKDLLLSIVLNRTRAMSTPSRSWAFFTFFPPIWKSRQEKVVVNSAELPPLC